MDEEKHILCDVELTQEQWDRFKETKILPRPIVLKIFQEHDAKRAAEEDEKKRRRRPDQYKEPSVIIDPLRRTAVKVNQIMPLYLNYGSFCKVASQCINELVQWMNVVVDCRKRCKEAKAHIQPGMITQSTIDYFTNLKTQSTHAMKQYDRLLFDMHVYIYIYNVINDYYKVRVQKNRYLVKNDIILDIFQDRKLEWIDNYRNGKNKAFFECECTEQDGYEQDFFNALKKYHEICVEKEDVHFTPEIGRSTRCKQTGDIDIAYVPEYINWFSRIEQRTDEEIVNQFHIITKNYNEGFVKMKTWRDAKGKLRFKFWANTPYYNEYNYNNDDWDEDPTEPISDEVIDDAKSNTNTTDDTISRSNKINTKNLFILNSLTNIYNSGYEEKSYCSYIFKSNKNTLSNNYYSQNFNIDNGLYNNIYKECLNISYINNEYLESISSNVIYDKIVNSYSTSYLCNHDSPPGNIESDKPPDGFDILSFKPPDMSSIHVNRYIFDRSIII